MAGQFLRPAEMADLKRELGKANSMRKRAEWEQHPTRAVVCGCPDRTCGGWHQIDLSRTILTEEESALTLKEHSKKQSAQKRKRRSA